MTGRFVVGVRLRRNGPVQWFDPADHQLDVDDLVVVPGEAGPDVGRVVVAPAQLHDARPWAPLPVVLDKADPLTADTLPGRVARNAHIRDLANNLFAERGLRVRVTQARLSLDAAEVRLELDQETSLPEDLLATLAERFQAHVVLAATAKPDQTERRSR